MTEAQQTEMDPRDPLRRLSVENRWGAHTGSEVDDRASSVLGVRTWIHPPLCHQQAVGDGTSRFSSASFCFPVPPSSWIRDQGSPSPPPSLSFSQVAV